MNRVFCLFFLIAIVIGCSEGDIIDNDINFVAELDDCFNANDFVIFKIDSSSNRAISLNFTSTTFEVNNVPTELTETITLNGTSNSLIYRKFDSEINSDYFCSSIPAANVTVTEELISGSGIATITYTKITDNTYTRTITLSNITFTGPGIEIRQELFELGSYEITIP